MNEIWRKWLNETNRLADKLVRNDVDSLFDPISDKEKEQYKMTRSMMGFPIYEKGEEEDKDIKLKKLTKDELRVIIDKYKDKKLHLKSSKKLLKDLKRMLNEK
jgi:hypothetical protein